MIVVVASLAGSHPVRTDELVVDYTPAGFAQPTAAKAPVVVVSSATPPPPRPVVVRPSRSQPQAHPVLPVSQDGDGAAAMAVGMVGVPYRWGGSTPAGFDCSGLAMFVWASAGVRLPHNAGAQEVAVAPVDGDWRPGDLLFYAGHVAIFVGDGMMVEAPGRGRPVRRIAVRRAGLRKVGRP